MSNSIVDERIPEQQRAVYLTEHRTVRVPAEDLERLYRHHEAQALSPYLPDEKCREHRLFADMLAGWIYDNGKEAVDNE